MNKLYMFIRNNVASIKYLIKSFNELKYNLSISYNDVSCVAINEFINGIYGIYGAFIISFIYYVIY